MRACLPPKTHLQISLAILLALAAVSCVECRYRNGDITPRGFGSVVGKAMESVVFIKAQNVEMLISEAGIEFKDNSSFGSGIVVDSSGYILTCWHVVEGAQAVYVTIDGQALEARLMAKDELLDLAMLKVTIPDKSNPSSVTWGNSALLQEGDWVFAVGYPFGLAKTADIGIVSALDQVFTYPVITTDAAINPGHSGGGLFNGSGELIGINNMIWGPGGMPFNVGLAYAIPGNTARLFVIRNVPVMVEQP